LDYQSQWLQLEHSQNPFAIVVMAHLKTQETKRRASDRKTWKITLVKRLYEAGYSRSDVLNLFNFVDWLMILPEGLKQAFWQELKTYEEERKMPYITSVEQIGYDRGMKVGEETGQRSLILRLLTRKVGSIPDRTLDCINHLSIAQLESLGEALLDFSSIADLAAWLENQG
jgi:predicted DNA-binding ribbon-helix-helix protein